MTRFKDHQNHLEILYLNKSLKDKIKEANSMAKQEKLKYPDSKSDEVNPSISDEKGIKVPKNMRKRK